MLMAIDNKWSLCSSLYFVATAVVNTWSQFEPSFYKTLVAIYSKGHESELPASWGKAMIDMAGREEAAEGLWRECG